MSARARFFLKRANREEAGLFATGSQIGKAGRRMYEDDAQWAKNPSRG
jgi:hypothetical protein